VHVEMKLPSYNQLPQVIPDIRMVVSKEPLRKPSSDATIAHKGNNKGVEGDKAWRSIDRG
jgi:hypothetical protein